MQEHTFARDFCPKCMNRMIGNYLSCINCGNEDLIPTPVGYDTPMSECIDEEAEMLEDFLKEGTIPKEGFWGTAPKPTSKLELDEAAVNAILYSQFGYLTGLAGTGKSTLINELNRLHPDLLEVCATTGIAA